MCFLNALASTGALNLLTGVLAIATAWMAWQTKQMANATVRMFELESRPYLAIKDLRITLAMVKEAADGPVLSCQMRVGLILSNPGKVLVSYEVADMSVTVAGKTVDEPHFLNKGGVVHPSGDTVFSFPMIPNLDLTDFPATGVVSIRLSFRGAGAKDEQKCSARLRYTVQRPPTEHVDWIYLEPPTYS